MTSIRYAPEAAPAQPVQVQRARTVRAPSVQPPAGGSGGPPQPEGGVSYDGYKATPAGSRTQQGQNPYNPNAPRYNGVDDQDIAWANTATTAKRPDGSYAYKASERNHAQTQILDNVRNQDRELTDPMSGTSLRAKWGTFTDDIGGMRGNAQTQMTKYGDAYDGQDADTGRRINRLDDWNPDEQVNMDMTGLRDMRPNAQEAWTPGDLKGFSSPETRAWQAKNLAGVSTQGLRNYDAGGTMQNYLQKTGGANYDTTAQAGQSSYDPRAAVEEYARGAAADAKYVLADSLDATANAAARSGRLNTGFFDKDQGSVIRRVGENLNAGILQKAVDAAQIRGQIENTNSRNVTDANIAGLRERGTQAGLRSAEARDAGRLGLDAIDAATGYDTDIADSMDRMALDQSTTIDKNSLTAADATARYSLDQAQGIDDFNQKGAISFNELDLKRRTGIDDSRYTARRDATDASIKRQGMGLDRIDLANKLWGDSTTLYGDAVSGERDRITGQENFNRDLKQREKERVTNFWGGMATGAIRAGAAAAGG